MEYATLAAIVIELLIIENIISTINLNNPKILLV